jgi:hypothetical protein
MFPQGCCAFEVDLASKLKGSPAPELTSSDGREWWEAVFESRLGWVGAAVENNDVAMPSPRAQVMGPRKDPEGA